MSQNLMLAIHAEHKACTGHDVFTARPLSTTHITCDVCLCIRAEQRDLEKSEREYYESLKPDGEAKITVKIEETVN